MQQCGIRRIGDKTELVSQLPGCSFRIVSDEILPESLGILIKKKNTQRMRHKQFKIEGLLASYFIQKHYKESGNMLYEKVLCYAVEQKLSVGSKQNLNRKKIKSASAYNSSNVCFGSQFFHLVHSLFLLLRPAITELATITKTDYETS